MARGCFKPPERALKTGARRRQGAAIPFVAALAMLGAPLGLPPEALAAGEAPLEIQPPEREGKPAPASHDLYQKRKEWAPVSSSGENVSHFIYRDMNRNGVYDVGDRPMAKVAVTITGEDGKWSNQRSNIHGFVKFTNSLTTPGVVVSHAGTYTLKVQIPPGFELTSGNGTQTMTYVEEQETRAGMIVDRVPIPAGLAPVLTISGRIAKRANDGGWEPSQGAPGAHVVAVSPDGSKHKPALDKSGHFTLQAQPGLWRITASAPGSGAAAREVEVKQAPVRLSAMIFGENAPRKAPHGRIVDFESITPSVITKMPNGHAGLQWTNLIPVEIEYYGGEGYINNVVSGHKAAYNTSGYPAAIGHDKGFDFRGGYFGLAFLSSEGEVMDVKAWRGGQLIGAEEIELSSLGPLWFDADWRGITRLELSTRHYWQLVMDDLSFGLYEAPSLK